MTTAYDRVAALKLAQQQAAQRAMSPEKVGQKVLREWLGAQGFGAAIEPFAGADLVRRIEAVVTAERSRDGGTPVTKKPDLTLCTPGEPCHWPVCECPEDENAEFFRLLEEIRIIALSSASAPPRPECTGNVIQFRTRAK